MKADLSLRKIKNSFLVVTASTIVFSCGSFQSASYFESDGIYVSKAQTQQERPQEAAGLNKNNYYSQYFKDVADGNMPLVSDDTYFTDSETYTSTDQYQQTAVDNNISQIPWGGETTQTEIIVVNNTPNYLWGLSGFAFNNSPFWNNYYGNQFRFGYGNFYNPYFDFYGGYAGYWGGFNSFYSPFAYYGGFYNPYGFRNPWNRFGYTNIFGNRYNNFNNRDYNSTVARIKSGRGEKNYGNYRRNSKTKGDRQSKNNDADVQRTLNRVNVGRGVNSLGRTVLIGNSRNTRLGTKTAGNSVTARPKINGGTTGISRSGNVNPTKTANSSSGRFSQSRYNNTTRNRTNTTSPRKRRTKTRSVTRSNNRNQYNNNSTSRSYNNTKSNSYRSSNSSRSSNYSSPARSYNSGSSSRSSAGSSSSRGSSSGRRN